MIKKEKKEKTKTEAEKDKKDGSSFQSQELEECKKLKNEYLAGWQRARADFLNYKKEEKERMGSFLDYVLEGFILKILPIVDNFEIAEKKMSEDLKNNEEAKGLLQIKNQILDFLKSQKIEPINSLGKKFDPNLHEVVGEVGKENISSSVDNQKIEAENKSSGIIVEEIQKGYKIKGRLLRPAKVKISK